MEDYAAEFEDLQYSISMPNSGYDELFNLKITEKPMAFAMLVGKSLMLIILRNVLSESSLKSML